MEKVIGYNKAVEMMENGVWFKEGWGGTFAKVDEIIYVIRKDAWEKIKDNLNGRLIVEHYIQNGHVSVKCEKYTLAQD